jgi:ABC-type lipoprotein export system ATPase subunit
MQAISDIPQAARRKVYRVAGQSIMVEPQDSWSTKAIEKLFAGWYLSADGEDQAQLAHSIVIRSTVPPPQIPRAWPQFNIAGGGVCFTDGRTSYIDIEGSIIAIGAPDLAAVEVWVDGPMDLLSPKLTRIVTYALAGVLRRRGLFELHSGAMVEPVSGNGVLIIGSSGSGKSTLTVQLAAAAWPFLTDDVLVLDHEQLQVRAWPMRRCFAITSETFAASSFLQSRTSIENLHAQTDDKKQFVPHDIFATGFRENCVPRSLFFSQISGEPTSRVSALSAGETMTRLIRMNPWSCYDQTTAANHLAVLSALVKQARGYALFAGTDLLNPENAARLIAKHVAD